MSVAPSVVAEALYEKESFPEEPKEAIAPKPEELAQFKQQVAEWIKIDDQIRKLSIATRERRTHQRALGKKIQEFMILHKYDNLDLNRHGIIHSNIKQVTQPVKLNEIKTKIEELDSNTALTKEQLKEKFFNAERPTVRKQSLSRKIPKVSMHLDL